MQLADEDAPRGIGRRIDGMDPAAPLRLHALDSLRATMMWLGIVLHVAFLHVAGPTALPWRDERRTLVADMLVTFIHAFRMPVFFILAGFFVALLAQRLGALGMLRHRLRRLALPFAVFWPALWYASGFAALAFLNRIVHGRWGLDASVVPAHLAGGAPNTMHLWFLWMLIWYCVATALVLRLRGRWLAAGLQRAGRCLALLGSRWWGFVLLALPLAVIGTPHPGGFLPVTGSFLPPPPEWLHHGLFFAFGFALFAHQGELFAAYRRHWLALAVAGLAFFLLAVGLLHRHAHAFLVAYAYNCAGWLWSFAWIGLALRWLEARRGWLAWMAESAYWVYLVHMPLTLLFGAVLFGLPWPAGVKIVANIAATTAVCLGTYACVVRRGWIGVLLNGRRHPRGGAPVKPALGEEPGPALATTLAAPTLSRQPERGWPGGTK